MKILKKFITIAMFLILMSHCSSAIKNSQPAALKHYEKIVTITPDEIKGCADLMGRKFDKCLKKSMIRLAKIIGSQFYKEKDIKCKRPRIWGDLILCTMHLIKYYPCKIAKSEKTENDEKYCITDPPIRVKIQYSYESEHFLKKMVKYAVIAILGAAVGAVSVL